jgi:hypothetical protein
MPGLHFEMMERVDQGKRVREEEFDKSIFPRVKQLAEKYAIKYDPVHPVPDDDALADRLFAAGMEYAVEKGLWVLDTQKVVKFTEAEIWRFLDNYHTPLTLAWQGSGYAATAQAGERCATLSDRWGSRVEHDRGRNVCQTHDELCPGAHQ